jgi:hypothetical protein
VFIPLLKEAKARGLTYRIEQCPMPGWNITDKWHNNIAYAPGPWIALHRICERHGVGDQFRIHYDPSHAILMGQDSRSVFQFLKDSGYNFLIGGFHVKGQVIDPRGVSAWGYGGQTMQRGDWHGDRPSPDPDRAAKRLEETNRIGRARTAGHGAPRPARVPAEPNRRLARSSTGGARTAGWIAPDKTFLVVEHEYPKARIQDKARLAADSGGLHRLHPSHRRGRRGDVLAAARSAGLAGHRGAGRRARGLQVLSRTATPCPS